MYFSFLLSTSILVSKSHHLEENKHSKQLMKSNKKASNRYSKQGGCEGSVDRVRTASSEDAKNKLNRHSDTKTNKKQKKTSVLVDDDSDSLSDLSSLSSCSSPTPPMSCNSPVEPPRPRVEKKQKKRKPKLAVNTSPVKHSSSSSSATTAKDSQLIDSSIPDKTDNDPQAATEVSGVDQPEVVSTQETSAQSSTSTSTTTGRYNNAQLELLFDRLLRLKHGHLANRMGTILMKYLRPPAKASTPAECESGASGQSSSTSSKTPSSSSDVGGGYEKKSVKLLNEEPVVLAFNLRRLPIVCLDQLVDLIAEDEFLDGACENVPPNSG